MTVDVFDRLVCTILSVLLPVLFGLPDAFPIPSLAWKWGKMMAIYAHKYPFLFVFVLAVSQVQKHLCRRAYSRHWAKNAACMHPCRSTLVPCSFGICQRCCTTQVAQSFATSICPFEAADDRRSICFFDTDAVAAKAESDQCRLVLFSSESLRRPAVRGGSSGPFSDP